MNLFRPWLGQETFDQCSMALTSSNCGPSLVQLRESRERCRSLSMGADNDAESVVSTKPANTGRDTSSPSESKNSYTYYYQYYYNQLVYYASMQNYYTSLISADNNNSHLTLDSNRPISKSLNTKMIRDDTVHKCNYDKLPVNKHCTQNRSHLLTDCQLVSPNSHAKVITGTNGQTRVDSCDSTAQHRDNTGDTFSETSTNNADTPVTSTDDSLTKISSIVNIQDILTFQNLVLDNLNCKRRTLKPADQRPKKFICSECRSGFSNRSQLNSHIRTHTGERPFVCDYKNCQKSFTRNEELTRHRRIHSGIRPYPCRWCDKRFGRKDHLRKHERTHERRLRSTILLNYTSNQSLMANQLLNTTGLMAKVQHTDSVGDSMRGQSCASGTNSLHMSPTTSTTHL